MELPVVGNTPFHRNRSLALMTIELLSFQAFRLARRTRRPGGAKPPVTCSIR